MSTFTASARHISISPIENADRLELASIQGTTFVSIVPKDAGYRTGDLVVYIPEQAVLPENIISELGLIRPDGSTSLAGGSYNPDGTKILNRLKAVRFRGQLSQGVCYRPQGLELQEGVDYAEALGIVKWRPPVPANMAGDVKPTPKLRGYTDLENINYFPEVIAPGEQVVVAEKIHGTNASFSIIDGELVVASKGYASKSLSLIDTKDAKGNSINLYWQIAHRFNVLEHLLPLVPADGAPVTLFGEIFGSVQDLKYGNVNDTDFGAFDLRIGEDYLCYDEFVAALSSMNIAVAPLLYRGPFSLEKMRELAVGREQVSGKESCIREGVVVKPVVERYERGLGRVALKVISPKYLTRKGDATEYE